VEKGYITTQKEGRIFKYTVVVPMEEYRKFLLKELAHNFFNDSGKEMLEFLFNEKLISQDDLKNYFDLKIEIIPTKIEEPKFEYADEILNPKKVKKSKTKDKDKDKKKKKKKD